MKSSLVLARCVVAATLLFAASFAQAFMYVEGIVPTNPKPFESISVRIAEGDCDAMFEEPGYPRLSRDGNKIDLLIETAHEYGDFCIYPTATALLPIGAFPPGRYLLQVDRHYDAFLAPNVIETVGTIGFDVVAPGESVPALSSVGLLVLVLLMAGVAAHVLAPRAVAASSLSAASAVLRGKCLGHLAVLALLQCAPSAQAVMVLDGVAPVLPRPTDTVSVSINEGYCDAVLEAPGYPRITREGSRVVMLLETAHEYDDFCILPVAKISLPVGRFSAGRYSLQVDRHYTDFFPPEVVETVGVIDFTVASDTSPVPALSPWALAIAISALAVAGLSRTRSALLKKARRLVTALILTSITSTTWASMSVDGIVPQQPKAWEPVSVRVSEGYCDATFETIGYPKLTREGSKITLLLDTSHEYDDFCIYQPVTGIWPIGAFPPGRYSIQVDRHYTAFFPHDIIETIGAVDFVVIGNPEAIPALSPAAAAIAVIALLGIALLAFRSKRRTLSSSLCLCLVLCSWAKAEQGEQYIEVLLSNHPDAPTAEDVISYFWLSPPVGLPPLASFNDAMPNGAAYLLPLRASSDFRAWLDANPSSARSTLERYLLVRYSDQIDTDFLLQSLRADADVANASKALQLEFSSPGEWLTEAPSEKAASNLNAYSQYGREALNLPSAWLLAGGYALIGDADTGLNTDHPALRQFSQVGQFQGGNFIQASSLDVGNVPNSYDFDVDEAEPMPLPVGSPCNPANLLLVAPLAAGHGTHVAGLIAANEVAGLDVQGICRHCGIAMWKTTFHSCNAPTATVTSKTNTASIPVAITLMSDSGVQVVNLSLGGSTSVTSFCKTQPNDPMCLALAYATSHDEVIVASSGNARTHIAFPAADSRTIAAGGFDESYQLWDESPGGTTLCPFPPGSLECGSNYSLLPNEPKQELVASSRKVFSTTYPGKNWNTDIHCGDSFGPVSGYGLCTGTSMAAPQISGVVGLLRSINPLVPRGNPLPKAGESVGIRTVLAQTTAEAQAGQPWSQRLGYGRPDAAAAAARMLGTVEGHTARNRATPLFRFYSAAAKDYLETTSPQMAIAFAINQSAAYTPQGALVPGYAAFPQDPATTALPAPRANVYVLTTEYSPRPEWPALVPLYMMERTRPFPQGCTVGTPQCNGENRDFSLFTTNADIEAAHADGYSLRTIQGYVFQPCTPEPACIPPGAQKLYRECKAQDDDCAVFLNSERAGFEASGYTHAYPAGADKRLGYAYPALDSDGDGLVDGFEYAIGTRVDVADSDGDGISDGAEFPLAAVAAMDPCSGAGAGNCPADVLFWDGFQ